jgi:plastocyanin
MPIRRRCLVLLTASCALAAALVAAPAASESLTGRVEVREGGAVLSDPTATIVYFVADGPARKAAPTTATIETRGRRFHPQTIAVPVGSTVRFPNQDPIRHNVFSISPAGRFDLGLYGPGQGRARRFDHPGIVRLFCNVHRAMSAYVVVLDTPWHAAVDAEGRFSLTGLPEGSGTLHVWHPRCEPWSEPILIPAQGPIAVAIDATAPPVPAHLDKHGRPYPRDTDDEAYR